MVLKLSSLGGGSAANGFNIDIGTSGNTTVSLGQTYPAGGYSITSQLSDSSMDIYAIAEDESLAGYTGTKALNTSKDFNKIVIFGATSNDLLTFEFKSTVQPTSSGSDLYASPYITSISETVLSLDQTIIISGGNFGTSIEAYFIGSDNVERLAKNIVRSSNSELIITRPDDMYLSFNKIKLVNPGVDVPSANKVNESENSIAPAAYALSGGTITELNGYRYHTFTSSSSITFSQGGSIEVLSVAGGGGGGATMGGGGGAGGLLNDQIFVEASSTFSVTVGAGGAGGYAYNLSGQQGLVGSNTIFRSLISYGGGGGSGWSTYLATSGGSGGGANVSSVENQVPGSGVDGQGNRGGYGTDSPSPRTGGGGGGAGSVGGDGVLSTRGGNGGSGLQVWGSYYAGGGGGGVDTGATAGTGGIGGGGAGSVGTVLATSGTANTGGGGGGAGYNTSGTGRIGGTGGSGVVIIRYPI